MRTCCRLRITWKNIRPGSRGPFGRGVARNGTIKNLQKQPAAPGLPLEHFRIWAQVDIGVADEAHASAQMLATPVTGGSAQKKCPRQDFTPCEVMKGHPMLDWGSARVPGLHAIDATTSPSFGFGIHEERVGAHRGGSSGRSPSSSGTPRA